MKYSIHSLFFAIIITSFVGYGAAVAQTPSRTSDKLAQSRAALIESTQQYKATTQELLRLQQEEVKTATQKLDELRQLVVEGLIARIELDQGEEALTTAKANLESTQKQIADSELLIAEIRVGEGAKKTQLAINKTALSAGNSGNYLNPTILRYTGSARWTIANLPEVQTFFLGKFGRSLPTSAIGQSATHNALGYDHRNAVDVALHPDSMEGKTLISYLQSRGIPYLAFRAAVPGVATGPHIHIGNPSHQLA